MDKDATLPPPQSYKYNQKQPPVLKWSENTYIMADNTWEYTSIGDSALKWKF